MTRDFVEVRLDTPESECVLCGKFLKPPRFGVPMYEGETVTADYVGEWAGFDCCAECHDRWLDASENRVRLATRNHPN